MALIADIFPKLRIQKNLVRSTSKNSRFKASFGKEHGKSPQTLLKFAWQYLYHIYWLLWTQLTCKKSLLVICKISRPFPNALSAYCKCSLFTRGNLTQPIQMQLSRKQKTFSNFFLHFWNLVEILNIFKQKDDSHTWGISEITDSEKHDYVNVKKIPFQRILRKATW